MEFPVQPYLAQTAAKVQRRLLVGRWVNVVFAEELGEAVCYVRLHKTIWHLTLRPGPGGVSGTRCFVRRKEPRDDAGLGTHNKALEGRCDRVDNVVSDARLLQRLEGRLGAASFVDARNQLGHLALVAALAEEPFGLRAWG